MKNPKNLSRLYDFLNELSYYFFIKYGIINMVRNMLALFCVWVCYFSKKCKES